MSQPDVSRARARYLKEPTAQSRRGDEREERRNTFRLNTASIHRKLRPHLCNQPRNETAAPNRVDSEGFVHGTPTPPMGTGAVIHLEAEACVVNGRELLLL